MEFVFFFVFFYPLFMALFWIMGASTFFFRRERGRRKSPELETYPRVAILVPCHNEEICIRDAIEHLEKNNYPNFEIIAINDGSIDDTGDILEELATQIDKLRIVTLTHNHGKAMALRAGTLVSPAEFLMCIDADSLLDKDALFWMMRHFLDGPRVGAVTGNPRVINRNRLLPRIQIGEFSAIIGMIKRTQRSLGRLFTVSGVNTCYRRAAVHHVGYWSPDTLTEDVDISWKLQLKYWDIRYEPQALTWILVPETIRSLWRQRLRWAKGGVEAATRYARDISQWSSRRMWTVFAEYWIGVLWCYALAMTIVFWAMTKLLPEDIWPQALRVENLVPGWTGVILAVACLLQFAVGLMLDSPYERRGLLRYLFWAIWYPALYWLINALTTIIAVPVVFYRMKNVRTGIWKSPVRRTKQIPAAIQRMRKQGRRQYFLKREQRGYSQRAAEVLVTVVFWGLWSYLIMPLISLLLWLGGVYLFTDHMIAMGGYETFAEQLISYSAIILVIWMLLILWIFYNQLRYGRHEKRNSTPRHISDSQVCAVMGFAPTLLEELRNSKTIFLHYDENDRPVIEQKAP